MGRVAALGCIVCRKLGLGATAAEVHHLRGNGWGRATDTFIRANRPESHARMIRVWRVA
ncbi:MAG: Recombination enhancement, RecA-dependent nuclease [Pseudomonadota bacterium]|jgi:hypothetical protein